MNELQQARINVLAITSCRVAPRLAPRPGPLYRVVGAMLSAEGAKNPNVVFWRIFTSELGMHHDYPSSRLPDWLPDDVGCRLSTYRYDTFPTYSTDHP